MTSGLRIELRQGDHLSVAGQLDHRAVVEALTESRGWFKAGTAVLEVDLSGVTRSESAGIALLLEWQRLARQSGRRIEFLNPPPQLQSLLKFFDLERVLTLRA
jgi:phospholipid transport system transporter-binding protein